MTIHLDQNPVPYKIHINGCDEGGQETVDRQSDGADRGSGEGATTKFVMRRSGVRVTLSAPYKSNRYVFNIGLIYRPWCKGGV